MEPIKQEIINNIFENGDKLITGPILQTVLIDMIDDVNVKDQEILSKTGSWDNAVTQIPNLATKAEVTNLSESVARDLENVVDVDLTGYATEQWVQNQGYLTEHQDISGLATKTELTAAENNLQTNITSLSESVARDLANVPEGVATEAWVQSQDYANKAYVDNAVSSSSVDLTGYATETWVESQGYLKEHQDISNLATKSELNSVSQSIQTDITNLATKGELNSVSQSVQTDITNLSESVANSAVWKKGTGQDSAVLILTGNNETKTPTATRLGAVAIGSQTTASGYYSHAEGQGTEASGWGSHAEGNLTIASGENSHAEGNQTTASGNFGSHAEGFRANASGQASHAEGSFTKALGDHSHAEGEFTIASGSHSHAEGKNTIASGSWSHAEGQNTTTSGECSHAEGQLTTASGVGSHAEGQNTIASNDYEHAQGRYNLSSENQIFSIGTGNSDSDRRNVVSILEVPNSDTQVVTASVFVQNVGGYDGTNPTPGTNDLATVINNLPSGGGSSETLWKKGTGQDSIVQVIANGYHLPTATGNRAIAVGEYAKASGICSHAEGVGTKASGRGSHAEGNYTIASGDGSHAEGDWSKAEGDYSHAEGNHTTASGEWSHAEGLKTVASNQYEHAQGRFNHNSENQIFSIGTGNSETDRRNAVSVLEVDNSGSYTSSLFVQNIGGYDGTNPTPGTNDLATVINGMSSGGGSSETLWKKGTGKDSAVLILTGDDEAKTPTATGIGAVAIGSQTTASGLYSYAEGHQTIASGESSHAEGSQNKASKDYSHAEGKNTNASNYGSHAEGQNTLSSGICSHAEGFLTVASGDWSHAEGKSTIASNECEHAQGRYNHNSTNQIFSIGTGNSSEDRRNAVSVLEVSNNNSYTSSVFVQNVGGYDGTNPLPGTNDLATVISNLPSGGTSSETWTFTLEDGSTVTKNIVMR